MIASSTSAHQRTCMPSRRTTSPPLLMAAMRWDPAKLLSWKASRHLIGFTAVTLLLFSGVTRADEVGDSSGFTVLSNATNVTHWGLGVGVEAEMMPYKAYGTSFSPIPFLYIDNKWLHVEGTTVDLKVGQWDGVTVAMRGSVGLFDGYKQSDAPILNGMQNRNSATFWYGPAFSWKGAFGTLSSSYLFGGNKGHQASLDYRNEFNVARWAIEPHITAGWFSSDYVNYYYGVRPSEARPGRPAYQGTSTAKLTLGTRIAYRFTDHQQISVDVGVSRLGSGITDSPLVGKRYVADVALGYFYQFN